MRKRNPHRRRQRREPKHEELEPRRYSPADESFARRLNAGIRMMKGYLE